MATEQLALDLGDYGWAAMPKPSTTAVGSHFRGFCGKASAWDTSAIYDAADRAWRASLSAEETEQPTITGSSQLSPTRTALELRARLGIRDHEPVANMVTVMHRLGCVVAPMPAGAGQISAFSCWFDDIPLAMLRDMGASRRRVRFDAAHELGHLMMHKGVDYSKEAEREANEFAGALLIPAPAFEHIDLKPFTWDSVKSVADYCNVNLLPSLRRAFDLDLISGAVYTAAMADSARRGWRARDPYDTQDPETLTTDR